MNKSVSVSNVAFTEHYFWNACLMLNDGSSLLFWEWTCEAAKLCRTDSSNCSLMITSIHMNTWTQTELYSTLSSTWNVWCCSTCWCQDLKPQHFVYTYEEQLFLPAGVKLLRRLLDFSQSEAAECVKAALTLRQQILWQNKQQKHLHSLLVE